jgi:hypothetical protein
MKRWVIVNDGLDNGGEWQYCPDCAKKRMDRRNIFIDGDSAYEVPEWLMSIDEECDDCLATVEDGRE